MPRFPLACSGLVLLARLGGAGETADFLLPENPASLRFLNRYEQPLTPEEKRELLPYSPLRIVAEKALLGDGITSVKEVRFEGHPYYLLRGDGAGDPPGTHRYRNCRVLDDREKAAGADIRCALGALPGGRPRLLRKGQAVRTVFVHGSHTYVKIPGARAEYAWCPSGGPFVEKGKAGPEDPGAGKEPAPPGRGMDPGLQSLLGARMEAANAAYSRFTQAFNQLTGESREPPRWECAFSPEGMDCRLRGDLQPDDLAKSSAVLAEDLRISLAGRPFTVVLDKGGISIAPRTETPRGGKDSRRP